MACDVRWTAGMVAGGRATGGLGRGDDGKRPGGGARFVRVWPYGRSAGGDRAANVAQQVERWQ